VCLVILPNQRWTETGISFSDFAPVSKSLNPDPSLKFFQIENPTPVQTPETIDAAKIQQCFYLSQNSAVFLLDIYEDLADSYCRK